MTSQDDPILAVLSRTIGLEARSLGTRALDAVIATHMARLGIDDRAAFAERLEDPTVRAALIDDIVVPETWFFRDVVPFRHLAMHARTAWRPADARDVFRVLCVPCSTGEEPYSVAITLLEKGMSPEQIHIDAVDLSAPLLERARAGVYGDNSFRGAEQATGSVFIERADGGKRRVVDSVRELVQFRHDNLCRPAFLAGERPYNAIFCRNLLIYLTASARSAALRRLEELLAPGGLLFTGHAEALEVMDPRFRPVGVAGSFAYTRRDATARVPVVAKAPPAPKKPAATRPTPPLGIPRAAPPPPAPALDPIAEARALADRGRLAEAAVLCEAELRTSPGDANAHQLLGTIRAAQGASADAEACFSRALYCDPQHYTALVQLALLLEQRGERDAAKQLRRRAEKVASTGGRR